MPNNDRKNNELARLGQQSGLLASVGAALQKPPLSPVAALCDETPPPQLEAVPEAVPETVPEAIIYGNSTPWVHGQDGWEDEGSWIQLRIGELQKLDYFTTEQKKFLTLLISAKTAERKINILAEYYDNAIKFDFKENFAFKYLFTMACIQSLACRSLPHEGKDYTFPGNSYSLLLFFSALKMSDPKHMKAFCYILESFINDSSFYSSLSAGPIIEQRIQSFNNVFPRSRYTSFCYLDSDSFYLSLGDRLLSEWYAAQHVTRQGFIKSNSLSILFLLSVIRDNSPVIAYDEANSVCTINTDWLNEITKREEILTIHPKECSYLKEAVTQLPLLQKLQLKKALVKWLSQENEQALALLPYHALLKDVDTLDDFCNLIAYMDVFTQRASDLRGPESKNIPVDEFLKKISEHPKRKAFKPQNLEECFRIMHACIDTMSVPEMGRTLIHGKTDLNIEAMIKFLDIEGLITDFINRPEGLDLAALLALHGAQTACVQRIFQNAKLSDEYKKSIVKRINEISKDATLAQRFRVSVSLISLGDQQILPGTNRYANVYSGKFEIKALLGYELDVSPVRQQAVTALLIRMYGRVIIDDTPSDKSPSSSSSPLPA